MEKWKIIGGSNYEVSSCGNVLSNNYNKTGRVRFLKPQKISEYLGVTLFINKERKIYLVHRLVLEAFMPNPENKETVNHINGKKHDNRLCNLEWNTRSENQLHAFKTGLQDKKRCATNKGKMRGMAHRKRAVIVKDLEGNIIGKYSNIREAAHKYNANETSISNCLNGRSKTSGGKKWEYV